MSFSPERRAVASGRGPYRVPMWLSVGYVLLLGLVAFVRPPSDRSVDAGTRATQAPEIRRADCAVCGIDKACDPKSGQCRFIETTPLPCIEGTKMDEKAGFCLPTGEVRIPQTTEAPSDGFPGRDLRTPSIDIPGFGNDNDSFIRSRGDAVIITPAPARGSGPGF